MALNSRLKKKNKSIKSRNLDIYGNFSRGYLWLRIKSSNYSEKRIEKRKQLLREEYSSGTWLRKGEIFTECRRNGEGRVEGMGSP